MCYTLYDGRVLDANCIAVVTVFSKANETQMEVVFKGGEKVLVHGEHVMSDAAGLDRLQQEKSLTFGVFYK